jgi:uncharacterized protein
MKKLLLIFSLLFCVSLFAQKSIPKPNPPRLVVDNADILSGEQKAILEEKLVALDDSTSNQIAIVTVKTLNDEPIEDVAVNTFRDWGIGNKKTSNGILILVAVDDRKIRIEVGYGLEGAIPDITANSIIDNDIKPAFRQKNYYHGLDAAVDDLSKAAVGEYKVQRARHDSGSDGSGIVKFIAIVIFVVVLLAFGGRGGGGGGGFIAPMILGSMLGGGGRSSSGWGDSGGGGGFGGFGGGSSGGGGASGSW